MGNWDHHKQFADGGHMCYGGAEQTQKSGCTTTHTVACAKCGRVMQTWTSHDHAYVYDAETRQQVCGVCGVRG